MIGRILKFLERPGAKGDGAPNEADFDRRQVAAAALMVEASRLDTDFDQAERDKIKALISERFHLPSNEADALIAVAEQRQDEVYSDFMFTQAIVGGFTEDERAEILEMLWEVAYADGSLHRFEEHMIKRVTNDLELTEAICESARQRAMKKLGISDKS